ncbi:hypothetical protein I316_06148 [Kwoniella heveanensis BCC8398]|uniref:Uncharacterized protein n=1 Tax=Kwoniella heveanensis BCC8398 TaxID=1296120 RepID=A0A1B9GM89_9TREE|nr:hypothetical protein I316_06148 [Kwoniella heveanensis BCC8398]
MASLLLGIPNSLPTGDSVAGPIGDGKKKKIPKVALYVAGAAFAITTGLTILVIPYVRQAAKLSNPTQFMSHRSLAQLSARTQIPRPPPSSLAASANASGSASGPSQVSAAYSDEITTAEISASQLPTTSTAGSSGSTRAVPEGVTVLTEQELLLQTSRAFNAREEKSLYGASLTPMDGEEGFDARDPAAGLLGFKALAVATALVWGSAGLGALVVAKLMGVDNMSDFASKMRENLGLSMPGLKERVNQPGRSTDGFDGEAIDQWVATLEKEDEENERALAATEGSRQPS